MAGIRMRYGKVNIFRTQAGGVIFLAVYHRFGKARQYKGALNGSAAKPFDKRFLIFHVRKNKYKLFVEHFMYVFDYALFNHISIAPILFFCFKITNASPHFPTYFFRFQRKKQRIFRYERALPLIYFIRNGCPAG